MTRPDPTANEWEAAQARPAPASAPPRRPDAPLPLPPPLPPARRTPVPLEDESRRAQRLVPLRAAPRRALTPLLSVALLAGLCLTLVPWQQSVAGRGRVGVYSVMERRQSVEALLSGRLDLWKVQEGQRVTRGQVLARIVDTDARQLDPARLDRVRQQLLAQRQRRAALLRQAGRLEGQIAALMRSRDAQLQAARTQIAQAKSRRNAATQNAANADQAQRAAEQVAVAQAAQRLAQAQDRVLQAEQALTKALADREAETFQRERIARLFAQGLRSERDDQFAARDLVARQSAAQMAQKAVEIARKEVEATRAAAVGADIEVQRARNNAVAARESLSVAEKDIANARAALSRIEADTAAQIGLAESNLQSVQAQIAAADDTIARAENDLANLQGRVDQQTVTSPVTGRIVRIGATVGAGQTVKAGDKLAEIFPETSDQAVELTLRGADAPLVAVGRPVRLQFNGFPAVQITGIPRAAYGTFAGRIAAIDPVDDGSGNVRVWVLPDTAAIAAGAEQPWPSPRILRPGTDAAGWVLLDTVPLWWEIWRQFNAFPPTVRQDPTQPYAAKEGSTDASAAKTDKPKLGDIKLPKR